MPHHAYPLMLDVAGRLVVIVGGGSVAARKAAGLLAAGATRVRCVAPAFAADLPAGVERVAGRYEPRHLDGAGLVFAATDDAAVNAAVVRDARARGVLVNRADATAGAGDGEPGDFSTPAHFREAAVTVAVSAGGTPGLAVLVRDALRGRWDARWSRLAEAMGALRPMILARADLPEPRRRQIFAALASPDALAALGGSPGPAGAAGDGGDDNDGDDDVPNLRAWLARRFPELAADPRI
jgi:siroheme synthase-like protein